jgi:hypothetical protein
MSEHNVLETADEYQQIFPKIVVNSLKKQFPLNPSGCEKPLGPYF